MSVKVPGGTTKNPFATFLDLLETVIYALAISMVLLTMVLRVGGVSGSSMQSTLENGDWYVVSNLFYTPQRGDIVVFEPDPAVLEGHRDEKETLFVKRIIALEGDVVDIRKNEETGICEVYVNDEKLDEPYLDDWQTTVPRNMEFPHTVAKNCLFVLGDNRIVSNDSRSIGDVDARRLVGRILIRIAPLNKFGAVEG